LIISSALLLSLSVTEVVQMSARNALGRYGEDVAARRLRQQGMAVLERNWRCVEGELDIVARDRDALVVCEVKTRRTGRGGAFEHPMCAVTPAKSARLRRLASRWLGECWLPKYGRPPGGGVRIDLVGVLLPERGAPLVQHARGVA
jgi:putative endonuclease